MAAPVRTIIPVRYDYYNTVRHTVRTAYTMAVIIREYQEGDFGDVVEIV